MFIATAIASAYTLLFTAAYSATLYINVYSYVCSLLHYLATVPHCSWLYLGLYVQLRTWLLDQELAEVSATTLVSKWSPTPSLSIDTSRINVLKILYI